MYARLFAALMLSALLVAIAPATAKAHGEEVSVTPPRAAPGQMITVNGKGFTAGTEVTIGFAGDAHALGRVHVEADGTVSFAAEVPTDLAPGPLAVVVTAGTEELRVPFEVLPMGATEGSGASAMEPAAMVAVGLVGVIPSISEAAEALVEGTIAALLPILWLLTLALHLARPYMLQNLQKFTLRLGADLWWLIYRGARDFVVLLTFMLSSIFYLPHVAEMVALPITGPLAGIALFGALLVKLTRDSDDEYQAFVLESNLLVLGAAMYWFGFFLGPAMAGVVTSGPLAVLSQALTSTTNLSVAVLVVYASWAVVTLMGLYAVSYNLRLAASSPAEAG